MPPVAPPSDSAFGALQERASYLHQEIDSLRGQVQDLKAGMDANNGAIARLTEQLIIRGQQSDRLGTELRLNTEATQRVEKSVETIVEVFENLRGLWVGLAWLSTAFVAVAKVLAPIAIVGAVVLAFWGSARAWLAGFLK